VLWCVQSLINVSSSVIAPLSAAVSAAACSSARVSSSCVSALEVLILLPASPLCLGSRTDHKDRNVPHHFIFLTIHNKGMAFMLCAIFHCWIAAKNVFNVFTSRQYYCTPPSLCKHHQAVNWSISVSSSWSEPKNKFVLRHSSCNCSGYCWDRVSCRRTSCFCCSHVCTHQWRNSYQWFPCVMLADVNWLKEPPYIV